ncbi:MAG: NADH-quinone oxidoreductase subunit N [Nocardioidaceae bacterium]
MPSPDLDMLALAPPLLVALAGILVLVGDLMSATRSWLLGTVTSAAALMGAGVTAWGLHTQVHSTFCASADNTATSELPLPCSFVVDHFTLAIWTIVLGGAFLVVLLSMVLAPDDKIPPGEFHFLLLSSVAGALTLAAARDFVTLVVALELVSLPSIALVGLRRGDRRAARSAWTFYLVSVVSTAVTLMGISLVYGATGSVYFANAAVSEQGSYISGVPTVVLVAGMVLTLVGLLFKLGAVPFHMWVPDTYLGTSIPIAAYLSVVSKTAGLAALLLVLDDPFAPLVRHWALVVALVAGATMTIGNIAALRQRDAVGLLAWSSVAQAGFVIAPVVALLGGEGSAADSGLNAAVRYLAIYAVANLAAFAAVAHVAHTTGSSTISGFRGLIRRDPLTGAGLAMALLTLAGFPPAVIGLIAKYVALRPVIDSGHGWLAVVMAVNVALGLAYYLRFLAQVVAAPDRDDVPVRRAAAPGQTLSALRGPSAVVALGLAGLIALSVWPQAVLAIFY